MSDILSFVAPEPWMKDAACSAPDVDPDWWFDSGTYIRRHSNSPATELAIAVCNECPVRAECAQYAFDNDEIYGVWGGLTPFQRRVVSHRKLKLA